MIKSWTKKKCFKIQKLKDKSKIFLSNYREGEGIKTGKS